MEKKILGHLKGDIKGFKKEIKEDKTLISKINKSEKKEKNEDKKKKK
jgi:hypothetical protein